MLKSNTISKGNKYDLKYINTINYNSNDNNI